MLKGRIGQDTFRLKMIGWLTQVVAQKASDSAHYDKSPIPLPDFIASALLVECVVVKRKLGELQNPGTS